MLQVNRIRLSMLTRGKIKDYYLRRRENAECVMQDILKRGDTIITCVAVRSIALYKDLH